MSNNSVRQFWARLEAILIYLCFIHCRQMFFFVFFLTQWDLMVMTDKHKSCQRSVVQMDLDTWNAACPTDKRASDTFVKWVIPENYSLHIKNTHFTWYVQRIQHKTKSLPYMKSLRRKPFKTYMSENVSRHVSIQLRLYWLLPSESAMSTCGSTEFIDGVAFIKTLNQKTSGCFIYY